MSTAGPLLASFDSEGLLPLPTNAPNVCSKMKRRKWTQLSEYFSALLILPQCLATPEPGLPALPLLLLLHLKHIGVGYVTTVLVRHWAVLYQQMGRSQQGGQLNERVSREFVLVFVVAGVVHVMLSYVHSWSTLLLG